MLSRVTVQPRSQSSGREQQNDMNTNIRARNSHQVFSDTSAGVPEKSVVVKASAPKLGPPSASSLLDSGSDASLPLDWALNPPLLSLASPSRQSDCSPVDTESS